MKLLYWSVVYLVVCTAGYGFIQLLIEPPYMWLVYGGWCGLAMFVIRPGKRGITA